MRPVWCVVVSLLAACVLEEPESEAPLQTSSEEQEIAGFCMIKTCGIQGTPGGCGMHDDGCGGIQWCGPCSCGSTFTACEIDLPVIAEVTVTLGPGQTLVASTSNLSSGADSVLHVLSSSGSQLAINDNISSSNVASAVSYTASWFGATVRVVARAKSASTTGTATLTFQSTSTPVTLTYPERLVSSSRAGDKLQTAGLPALENSAHVVYTMSGANITARTTSSTGVSLALPSSGTTRYLVGRAGTTGAAIPARLLRNDNGIGGHDPDQDGLGTNLETSLGTCTNPWDTATDRLGSSFTCSLASDMRDTDGDGLQDGWEVRGRTDVSPVLPLSRWGANPRHMDVFVEADYGQATTGEVEEAITHDEVFNWASYWADRVGTLTAARRAAHVASLRNPDGKVGVSLHVDSGVAPTNFAYAALYGNWGGHGVVPPDPDGGRLHFATAREQYMSAARRGVFRYALRAASGGGQGGGLAFVYGGGSRTAAHELGHTAQLYHDGRYNDLVSINCKPNYASIMNYGYDSYTIGFSDGTAAPTLNNAALVETGGADPATQSAFLQVLQSVYDLTVDTTNGNIDWNHDGVYAPAGQTVEAYANFVSQKSCEFTRAGFNNVAGPHITQTGPALARLGTRTLIFTAHTGHVGWTATTSSLQCRVPNGSECASWGASGELDGIDSSIGVDAVKLTTNPEVLVVSTTGAQQLAWTRITGFFGGVPTYTPIRTLASGGVPRDQPTLAIDETGVPELFYRDNAGFLYSRRYQRSTDTWAAAQMLIDINNQPLRMAIVGSPGATLARPLDLSTTSTVMHLVFAEYTGSGCMQMWHRNASGLWSRDYRMPSCDWRISPMGRPAIAWVPDPKDQLLGGRIHIVHTPNYYDPERSATRQMTSVYRNGSLRMSRESTYDNDWAYMKGIDLMYEPGIDTNLRAAGTHSQARAEELRGHVRFDPKADGITDYAYGNENDWGTMRFGICDALAGEQATPVTCPAEP